MTETQSQACSVQPTEQVTSLGGCYVLAKVVLVSWYHLMMEVHLLSWLWEQHPSILYLNAKIKDALPVRNWNKLKQ